MKTSKVNFAKLSPPKIPRPLKRERLFAALDAARERQIVWVHAAAGSGKTTLVASYCTARRLRPVWYRVEDDDSDPATFVYHLGEAVRRASPRRRAPLPKLTPPFIALRAFAREFARQMFTRLPAQSLLVIDDYHEIAADSPVHEVVAEIVRGAPASFTLIVLSRSEPPSALAQMAAYERVGALGSDALGFTESEALAFVRLRGMRAEAHAVHAHWERSQGWIAGFILLTEGAGGGSTAGEATGAETRDVLFHYFAAEVLRRTSNEIRDFLLKSAVFVDMTAPMAAAISGHALAATILADLARRNYLTARYGRGDGYRFHPLFREFLLRTAEHELGPVQMLQLRARAARVLEQTGENERAAEMYAALGDWAALVRVLATAGAAMLVHGRHRILLTWLDSADEAAMTEHCLAALLARGGLVRRRSGAWAGGSCPSVGSASRGRRRPRHVPDLVHEH